MIWEADLYVFYEVLRPPRFEGPGCGVVNLARIGAVGGTKEGGTSQEASWQRGSNPVGIEGSQQQRIDEGHLTTTRLRLAKLHQGK